MKNEKVLHNEVGLSRISRLGKAENSGTPTSRLLREIQSKERKMGPRRLLTNALPLGPKKWPPRIEVVVVVGRRALLGKGVY